MVPTALARLAPATALLFPAATTLDLDLDALQIHLFSLVQPHGHNAREGDDGHHHRDLEEDERNRAAVDVQGLHPLHAPARDPVDEGLGRCHAAQVEEGEAEGRGQEGGLEVHRQQHAKPDQVDTQFVRHRRQQGHQDEGDLEEVDEKAQKEDDKVDEDQETELAARQLVEQMLHPELTVDGSKGEAEDGRADEDEQDKSGQARRRLQGMLEQPQIEFAAGQGHDQGPGGPHSPALGRRRDPEENGPQHQEDQDQRRDQDEGHPLGEPRQQPQAQGLVDQGPDQGQQGRAGQGDDDGLVQGRLNLGPRQGAEDLAVVLTEGHRGDGDDQGEDRQGAQPRATVRLGVGARLGWQGRHQGGLENGQEDDEEGEEPHQHEGRNEGAHVQVADAAAKLVGHDDQHQGGWDDLRQGAGGGDGPGGDRRAVTIPQHDRQGDQAHGDDRGRHHAGSGGQQGADEQHR